jgi:hypothetical protein
MKSFLLRMRLVSQKVRLKSLPMKGRLKKSSHISDRPLFFNTGSPDLLGSCHSPRV